MLTDRMFTMDAVDILRWMLHDLKSGSALGLARSLFFIPQPDHPFRMRRYGTLLETPFGVAAGPQTQLAQNCVAAWLTGARYLELKTVQKLDSLAVTKPCIHMGDAGYNCEWSQELRLHQSAAEYIKAWVLIHVLRHVLGFPERSEEGGGPGFLCNLSVGYSLEGIKSAGVQEFLHQVTHCGPAVRSLQDRLAAIYPPAADLAIGDCLSRSVTISCMHGCPPEEVENIALYFLQDLGLHTTVKLNPTLLGPERVDALLHRCLGYDLALPQEAFDHDLRYADALRMLKRARAAARAARLDFGVKLTNTLETDNLSGLLPATESRVYLSGRPLHALALHLALRLREDCPDLDISFSAGGDAFNAPDVLAAGLKPLTVCSDLLKPGGYGRLSQYPAPLAEAQAALHAPSLEAFICARAGLPRDPARLQEAALINLRAYAARLEQADSPCRKACVPESLDAADHPCKTQGPLPRFDCAAAPCQQSCPLGQNIPLYLGLVAAQRMEEARAVIQDTNPLPCVQGMVCDQPCQGHCVRTAYDRPLDIRGVKRAVLEACGEAAEPASAASAMGTSAGRGTSAGMTTCTVAVIGAGPSGLACAALLAAHAVEVHIFEALDHPGGMAAHAIPAFRLAPTALQQDMARIVSQPGVHLHLSQAVDYTNPAVQARLQGDYAALYVAVGAQHSQSLGIPGEDSPGVWNHLDFLRAVARGDPPDTGGQILVVGGGNAAMDVARAARRLRLPGGVAPEVSVIYRRSAACMPCAPDEWLEACAEGVSLRPLLAPVSVHSQQGRISGLEVQPMAMDKAQPGPRKKARSLPTTAPTRVIPATCLVVAIGQKAVDLHLIAPKAGWPVYGGGDAARGASSLVKALADGRRAARQILRDLGLPELPGPAPVLSPAPVPVPSPALHPLAKGGLETPVPPASVWAVRRARRDFGRRGPEANAFGPWPLPDLRSPPPLPLVPPAPLSRAEAQAEAGRCLRCDLHCATCVSVCPNRANVALYTAALPLPLQEVRADPESGGCHIHTLAQSQTSQPCQIFHLADLCNECGNCATFCPTGGSPYREKIRLHRSRESFISHGCGYYLAGPGLLEGHHGGRDQYLCDSNPGLCVSNSGASDRLLRYRDPCVQADLDPQSLQACQATLAAGCGQASLLPAVEMALVYLLLRQHPLFAFPQLSDAKECL